MELETEIKELETQLYKLKAKRDEIKENDLKSQENIAVEELKELGFKQEYHCGDWSKQFGGAWLTADLSNLSLQWMSDTDEISDYVSYGDSKEFIKALKEEIENPPVQKRYKVFCEPMFIVAWSKDEALGIYCTEYLEAVAEEV